MKPAIFLAVVVLSAIPARGAVLFREDFESGLSRWTASGAKVVSDPDRPGNSCLRITNGEALISSISLPAEFALTARVRFVEKTRNTEAPFKLHIQPDGAFVQVYPEANAQEVRLVVQQGGRLRQSAGAPSPVPLEVGRWTELRIVCAGGLIGASVNGKPALFARDPLPQPGGLGLRVGEGTTDYDDITVTVPTPADREFKGFRSLPGAPLVPVGRQFSTQMDGRTMVIEHNDIAFPLQPLSVKITGARGAPSVTLVAPDGRPTGAIRLSSSAGGQVPISGPLGDYTLVWKIAGREAARTTVRLVAETAYQTGDPADARFFGALRQTVQSDSGVFQEGGRRLRTNPSWVRDHIHEMKGYRWWESDLTSFIDRLIELQPARGFFHEIITSLGDPHLTYVKPEFVYRDEPNHTGFVRLELEADVEYLMVEGVHTIWQATGDTKAMARRLPALERGLRYNLQDPTRWDKAHGLMKRPFTIDTWDFTWGVSTSNRGIDPDMAMAIMHGDNSGLYRACLQVAEMRSALGDKAAAAKWRETARGIRERANRLLWAGRFYQHQYHLKPIDTGGPDEREILSLSNTYDINRGLPTHEMAVRIIDEYRERRKRNPKDVAEWYALDPPYPEFVGYKAGQYINGGVAGFVAGELAKAAFRHGREDYAADILRRVREVVEKDGALYFLTSRDGKDIGMGPRGWGAAAVLSAMMEGLAGITDQSTLFRKVEIAPRFPAAGIKQARVCLRYGPSDAYVAGDYSHDPKSRTITIRVAGSAQQAAFHVLLPKPGTPASVRVNGRSVKSVVGKVEQSAYCDFRVTRSGRAETVAVVAYR